MWQRAHALAIAIHKLAHPFGRAGYAHLRGQLARAADSIESNIVEGCGADTNKEFARFLDMSIKSANETELRATMSWPGDEQRHADLNVFFIHTPAAD